MRRTLMFMAAGVTAAVCALAPPAQALTCYGTDVYLEVVGEPTAVRVCPTQ